MVTIKTLTPAEGSSKNAIECTCLSTDTKPTYCANGSICIEIDTSTLYFFDESAKTWRAWS